MSETRRQAELRMMDELRDLQRQLEETWVDRSLPEGWNGLDSSERLPKAREKVTLRLDADMLRWFRRLGPGYGQRINTVLRVYWEALVAGRIKAHRDEPDVAPAFLDLVERLAEAREEAE